MNNKMCLVNIIESRNIIRMKGNMTTFRFTEVQWNSLYLIINIQGVL